MDTPSNTLKYCHKCLTIYLGDDPKNYCGCKPRAGDYEEWYNYYFNRKLEFSYEEAKRDLELLYINLRNQEKQEHRLGIKKEPF